MKSSVLLVVACIHLGGSYYNQTSLSSVLSTFEAQLTVPRQKEAEQIAPVSTAVPAPAAAPLLHADDTSKDTPADATLTPADATLLPANVTSVDTSSTAIQVHADDTSEDTPADATLLPANVTSVDTSLAAIQVLADDTSEDKHADATLLPADVASVDTSSAAIQVYEEFSVESASAAVTKTLAEISTVSTEPAVTRSTTKVSTSSERLPQEREGLPQEREGLPQEREAGQVENTAPRAALPSHVVANSGSSRVWTYKEVSLVAHLSQVMWLTALTGISTYFLGANAHLWRAVENLRRARA